MKTARRADMSRQIGRDVFLRRQNVETAGRDLLRWRKTSSPIWRLISALRAVLFFSYTKTAGNQPVAWKPKKMKNNYRYRYL